MPIGCPDIFM